MAKEIFVNFPVKDLERSKEFFSNIGFTFNPKFSDEKCACLVIGENIYSMLLAEEFFKTFAKKGVSDAEKGTEAIMGISAETKEEVDEMFEKALNSGAKEANEPYDYGWMYGKSFYDLDGHMWEVIYMDKDSPDNPENKGEEK